MSFECRGGLLGRFQPPSPGRATCGIVETTVATVPVAAVTAACTVGGTWGARGVVTGSSGWDTGTASGSGVEADGDAGACTGAGSAPRAVAVDGNCGGRVAAAGRAPLRRGRTARPGWV